MSTTRRAIKNHILSRLAGPDLNLLLPRLEAVDLPLRRYLEHRNKRVEAVYFMESGFASVVANGPGQLGVEVGIIGCEGMTGLSVVLGSHDRVFTETYMQNAGSGLEIRAADLTAAMNTSVSLHHTFLRYAYAFLNQTTRTAVANARGTIEQRLARWLLMAADRVTGELRLTQEFLPVMLEVQRPGVTAALKNLERAKLIAQRRGAISILDRDALIASSNGLYVAADSD
jgi:CRP-like cAMP-binding protein